jgi:integrase
LQFQRARHQRRIEAEGDGQLRADAHLLHLRFIEGYAKANRQKPSGVDSKESHFRNHLLPRFGMKRLDAFTDEDVQQLKAALQERSVKTVNNCLSTLSMMLKMAVKWKVIDRMPVEIEHLKGADSTVEFYEVEEYERLVEAAGKLGPVQQLVVLLGGEAGLRMGERIALEWSDVDLKRGLLKVQRSDWKGHVTLPKGGRPREVPLTRALASALVRARHLRGEQVLYREDGTLVSQQMVRSWMAAAQKQAGLNVTGAFHILRHTFCSHLAMRGVPRSPSRNWRATGASAPRCGTCTWGRARSTAPSRCWRRGGESLQFGDILETRRSQKAPGPETAEESAASGPDWSVPNGIRTRITGWKPQARARNRSPCVDSWCCPRVSRSAGPAC